MNAKIILKNKRNIKVNKYQIFMYKAQKNLKCIKCPKEINSSLIDELPLIFLVCAKAKGTSYFQNLDELRHKESDRLTCHLNF